MSPVARPGNEKFSLIFSRHEWTDSRMVTCNEHCTIGIVPVRGLGNIFGKLAAPGNAGLPMRTFSIHVDLSKFFRWLEQFFTNTIIL
jgi:hypothetical protein